MSCYVVNEPTESRKDNIELNRIYGSDMSRGVYGEYMSRGYSDTSRGNYGRFRDTGNSDMSRGRYVGYRDGGSNNLDIGFNNKRVNYTGWRGSVNGRVPNIYSNREPIQSNTFGMNGHVGRFCRHFYNVPN